MNTQDEFVKKLAFIAQTSVETICAHPFIAALLDGSIRDTDYLHYAVQTYHYVKHTCPLLQLAAFELGRQQRYPALAGHLQIKHREERGHEQWILDDIAVLGADADPARLPEPSIGVEAYVTWNRAMIVTGDPVSFLGTAYLLEYLSASRGNMAVERLLAESAIPGIGRAVGFLRGRASADRAHIAELNEMMSQVTHPEDQKQILLAAEVTGILFPLFFATEAYGDTPSTMNDAWREDELEAFQEVVAERGVEVRSSGVQPLH